MRRLEQTPSGRSQRGLAQHFPTLHAVSSLYPRSRTMAHNVSPGRRRQGITDLPTGPSYSSTVSPCERIAQLGDDAVSCEDRMVYLINTFDPSSTTRWMSPHSTGYEPKQPTS
jgi:hypothetical protein